MKRELTRFVLVMSSAMLAFEYSDAHFSKSIAFIITFIGVAFATLVVNRLNPLFEKLGWEEYVVRRNSEAILALPAIILTLLVMISVTHFFPPKKEKVEVVREIPKMEKAQVSESVGGSDSQNAQIDLDEISRNEISQIDLDEISQNDSAMSASEILDWPDEVHLQVASSISDMYETHGNFESAEPEIEPEPEPEIDWDEIRLQMLENIPDDELRAATAQWFLEIDQFTESMSPADSAWIDDIVAEKMGEIDLSEMPAEQRAAVRKLMETQAASVRMMGLPARNQMREAMKRRQIEMHEKLKEMSLEDPNEPVPKFQWEEENQ